MWRAPQRCKRLALFAVLAALGASPLRAASPDAKFIAGLSERRLFPLAERFLRERLGDQRLSDDERIELTIALSRTYAEHALHKPRSQREPLWQAAAQAADDFRASHADHPRRVLVDMQQALTLLARGELARQESEVGSPGAPTLDEARRELQQAITQLRAIGDEVEKQLRTATNREGEALTETELLSLQRNVRYQTARALRNQALCYAAKSAERSDALLQALELLKPVVQLEPLDSLIWKSRLDEAICLRLAGRTSEATARLDVIDAARPPSRVALDVRAERTRLALDQGEPAAALTVLQTGRELAGQTSAELDLAHVEAFLALWKAAKQAQDEKAARQWQDRAATMVRAMESLYGPYWTRRGEVLLAASAGAAGGDANIEVLIRAAKNHYLRQELDEAVIAYQRAGEAAAASDRAKALDLYLASALIERRRNRLLEALRVQQAAALKLRDVAKAPALHLQAVVDAAQLARDGSPDALGVYEALLREHIDTWPTDATSDQARIWLGRLQEHAGQFAAALATLRNTSPRNSELYLEAIDAVARVQTLVLQQQRESGQIDDAALGDTALGDAVGYFEQIVVDESGRLPQRWTTAQRRAALHAAQLRLQFTSSGFDTAQKLLQAALDNSDGESDEWKSQAKSLLVVAQAGAGDRQGAKQTLQALSGGSPAQQMAMLQGLQEIAAHAQADVAREIAALQLEVVENLGAGANRLSAGERQSLELIAAQALAATGRTKDALAKLEQLSRAHPDDGNIQRRYAELLSTSPDRPSQLAARDVWRNVLRRTPPSTPAWFEAKYAVALTHASLGENEQAAQMIDVLRTVQPDLGGPAMKARFLSLLARCRPVTNDK